MGKRLSQYKPDYVVAVIVIGLVLFGIIMVFSATYYSSQASGDTGEEFYYKQIQGAVIGLAAMFLLSLIDYHIFSRNIIIFAAVFGSIILLILVLFTEKINGAHRWLDIGFLFQPAELARFAIMLFTAKTLSKSTSLCRSKSLLVFVQDELIYFIALAGICVLIAIEPSLSMTLMLVGMVICIFIVAGVPIKPIIIFGTFTAAIGSITIFTQEWRMDRVKIFLKPWLDPSDSGYQLTQSLYALGSGGLLGVGLGNSKQKLLYLTYGNSDFILSIIGEELGFIGVALLLIAFIILIIRCFVIAINCKDLFGTLLAAGITATISIQLVLNVAVISCSIPPTGVPLPFISSGNTSLIVFMAAIGILLNISRQTRPNKA